MMTYSDTPIESLAVSWAFVLLTPRIIQGKIMATPPAPKLRNSAVQIMTNAGGEGAIPGRTMS